MIWEVQRAGAMLSSLYEGRLVNLTEVVVEDCLQIN